MADMPLSSITSAIVSSILSAVGDAPATQPAVAPTALVRSFPQNTLTGQLAGPPDMGYVRIDGKAMPAAPGLQIRNQMNIIVLPASIGADQPVRYQLEPMGGVWRIWLMTPAEVAAYNK
jgi:hypothetical protein